MESIDTETKNSLPTYDEEVNKLKLKIKLDIKLREFIYHLYSTNIKDLKLLCNWLQLLENKYTYKNCYDKLKYKKTNDFLQVFKFIMFVQNRQDYIDQFIDNLKIFELENEELINDILNVIDIKNYN